MRNMPQYRFHTNCHGVLPSPHFLSLLYFVRMFTPTKLGPFYFVWYHPPWFLVHCQQVYTMSKFWRNILVSIFPGFWPHVYPMVSDNKSGPKSTSTVYPPLYPLQALLKLNERQAIWPRPVPHCRSIRIPAWGHYFANAKETKPRIVRPTCMITIIPMINQSINFTDDKLDRWLNK